MCAITNKQFDYYSTAHFKKYPGEGTATQLITEWNEKQNMYKNAAEWQNCCQFPS
jgi:hypothetical protein